MEMIRVAKAGTLESNDMMVMVMPSESGTIEVEIESIVLKQYGQQIRETILKTVERLQVSAVKIKAQDKGALDYTIEARVEAALIRASQEVSA
ncbi:MAG: citrate lyase acyl carrier protein [Clostridia bacterium]|nr:citrate lyase acyl carrier protein [Clostridia bacterium]